MSRKILSIIVPVYNVEIYLKQCLDSLINQEMKNYEIIIVNDGSTDNSLSICTEYANKYDFITLISQKNKGLGAARNKGIECASGKYIGFVDSDDYICKNMYKRMLEVAINDDLDLVICAVKMYFEDTKKQRIIEDLINEQNIITKGELITGILEKKIQCFAWNKIYKRELFDDIKYEEMVYYEDIYTFYKIALKTKKIKFINEPLYIYRQRRNNITSNVSEKHIKDFNLAVKKVNEDYEKNNNFNKEMLDAFNINYFSMSINLYMRNKNFNKQKIYSDYKLTYGDLYNYSLKQILLNQYIGLKHKIIYILWIIKILPIINTIK